MPPSPSEKELSEISKLMVRWDQDWRNARPHFDEKKEDYLAYKLFRDPNSHPYKYNPVIPLVFTICENMVSTTFNNFFMKGNPMIVEPVEGMHYSNPNIRDEDIARQVERAQNILQMHPEREFMLEKYDLDQETTLFGNGYTMTLPVFDDEEESEIGGKLYIGSRVAHVSFWDIVPDRECFRLSRNGNCRWIWHLERNVSTEEYKKRVETMDYKKLSDDELKKLVSDKTWIPEDYHEDLKSTLGLGSRPEDGVDTDNGTMLLLHCYDIYTHHYKTIAANRMLVRDTSKPKNIDTPMGSMRFAIPPYPYCPYDDIRLWPFAKEFFARGVGRIARGFQNDINLLKSMRLDNLEMAILKVLQVNELYVDDLDDVMMIPMGIIPVKDINNAIKAIEVGDITQNAYVEQGMWEKESQEATGNFEHMRGSETARRETATMGVLLREGGMKRQDSFMKRVGHWYKSVGLKQIIQMRVYMSQREYQRIIGEPDAGFFQLTLREIKNMFDIRPSAAGLSSSREADQQNFTNAIQMVQGAPQYANIPEFFKLGMELFFPTKNPGKYILSQDQLALQQQQMAQQGGQGAPPPGQDQSAGYGQPTISPSQLIDLAGQGQLGGS